MIRKLLVLVNGIREKDGKKPLEAISIHSRLREDIELDSLDLAELTVLIERDHGIDIFEDGMISTIGDIIAMLDD